MTSSIPSGTPGLSPPPEAPVMKPRVALMYDIPADRMAGAADHCARHPWPTGWDNTAFRLAAERAFRGDDLLIRLLDLAPLPGTEAPYPPDALLELVRAAADIPGVAAADLPLAQAAGECPAVPVPERDGTGTDRTRALLRAAHARVAVPAFWGRITDAALLPDPEVPRRLAALRYPARPGLGEAVQQALSGGRNLPVSARPVNGTATTLASTSLFRRG
ncbi:hypothetical protein, partial [Streptomyces sp. 8N706]|uniref:hypothetical protein n=1 Tax=Streptomyces sp. 8N706 TaxID=3457416 RepID=UPI003FD1060B